jgi:flagellar biosynthesis/type III secretory pathway protein FliH
LFESAHPAAAPKDWQNLDVLVSKRNNESNFNAMDWDAVPKLDYASSQFRQLAIPEPARVIESLHDFVVEDFGASQREASLKANAEIEEQSEQTAPMADDDNHLFSAETSMASDLACEVAIEDPDQAEHTDAAQPMDVRVDEQDASPDAGLETTQEPAPSALDSAALAQACEEAYQRGLLEGREAAESQAEAALTQAMAEAAETAEKAQALALSAQEKELREKIESELALLREVTQKLEAWAENPKQLFEPLKRLAVHIAEQLVLAELNVSGAAIERLVQRCLDELNLHGTPVVTVELNAQDKARLQEIAGETLQHIQLQAVPGLQPASVRVIVNDTQVEDLVQHRLEALAHGLLGQPEAWREKSPFFRQPLAQRETDVQDVAQRPALPDAASDEVLDA